MIEKYIWNFPLTNDNYVYYAIRNYMPSAISTWNDFFTDLKLFNKLSKCFINNEHLRITLNTCIILGNVFAGNSLARLAFFHTPDDYHAELKTILKFMYRLPETIPDVNLNCIEINEKLFIKLRNL